MAGTGHAENRARATGPDAIQLYSELTGAGLKDAKGVIDNLR
jgi:ribosomal protein L7/L12